MTSATAFLSALPLPSALPAHALKLQKCNTQPSRNRLPSLRRTPRLQITSQLENTTPQAEYMPDVFFSDKVHAHGIDAEIASIIDAHKVVLFMKGSRRRPKCGFSASVVGVLEQVMQDGFVCVDCLNRSRNEGLRDAIKDFTKWPTIPQLYIDGEFIGGADIVRAMYETGELQSMLEKVIAE